LVKKGKVRAKNAYGKTNLAFRHITGCKLTDRKTQQVVKPGSSDQQLASPFRLK
jgi:hypothetical protein